MAWRTSQDVNTQSRHQYDVFVPEQEARTLSRRSNDAAAGVRTPRQASAVRSEPDANNTVMVGGDVQIEYGIHEDAEVNVPARQVFAAFIGKKELHTVVHLGGQTPRLAKTPSNLATAEPTAGVAYVSGTKKNGYTVRAYDRNEAVAVRDVLTAVGVPVGNFRTRVGPDRAGMVMKDVRETRHASDLEMSPRYKNQDMNKVDAELGHELSQDLGQKVPFEMGDNASVRDRRVLAGNYSVMNGGSLTTASPAVQAHVDRYGPLPQSFLDEKFQGGGVRAAFTDEPRTLGFSPTYGKQSRRVLGVWITDRFAGASATMGDLEYRFGLDKARWPVLPNEQGAAMDSVYMHETGHNIQNWFKWQGVDLALNLRTNQMLAEVGGEAGITRLVSDYAITSRNEMFSEILARSIHDPSMDRSLVSFIEDVYAGMRATEEWYATKDKSSPDLETAVLDAMNVKETR